MFTIKARLPDGTTDIYETCQMTISKDRKTLEFAGAFSDSVAIYAKPDYYTSIYIENEAGKTIEALYAIKEQ